MTCLEECSCYLFRKISCFLAQASFSWSRLFDQICVDGQDEGSVSYSSDHLLFSVCGAALWNALKRLVTNGFERKEGSTTLRQIGGKVFRWKGHSVHVDA